MGCKPAIRSALLLTVTRGHIGGDRNQNSGAVRREGWLVRDTKTL